MQAMDSKAAQTFRETGKFRMQVICEGLNLNKDYNFTRQALKDSASVFSHAQIVSGHPSPWEDPMSRNPKDLIGFLQQAEFVAKGRDGVACIEADAIITNEDVRENMANMAEAGGTDQIEFSILATVKAKEQIDGDKRVYMVEKFVKCYSVDHVLRGAAGGRVVTMQALDAEGEDFEDPDNGDSIMNAEQIQAMIAQNTKLELELKAAQDASASALARVKEVEDNLAAQAAQILEREVVVAIQSSTLPDASKARLVAQAKNFATVELAQAAITGEADYLKTLGITPAKPGKNPNPTVKQGAAGGALGAAGNGYTEGDDDGTPEGSGIVAGMGVTTAPFAAITKTAPIAQAARDPKSDPIYQTAYQRCRTKGMSEADADRAARTEALFI